MDVPVKKFRTPYELAEKFAGEMVSLINEAADRDKHLNVALSGGSTPELLFSILGDHFSKAAPWEHVHFFWGDERCVPPLSSDSNFGMTFRSLLKKISIPDDNIHRIHGESDPETEVLRYSGIISEFTGTRDGFPVFDLVLLGLGEDGHTASIFPGSLKLFDSEKICEVAIHPGSQQKRITITGRVINNAGNVTFLVTGRNKAEMVSKIVKKEKSALNLPASYVIPVYGKLQWLLDNEAGALL